MSAQRLTGLFVALLIAGCLAGIFVPAGLGWDFANFYDAGRRVVAGQANELYQPTHLIAGQPPQGRTGFYGTPLSAVLYVPLAGLSPNAALIWFKIQNVAAFLASFALLFHFYRRFPPGHAEAQWRFAALFAGLCLIFQPFWTVFRVGGQTTPTALLLITLAMICHTSARLWGSAICLVLATLIKPALAPMFLFLLCVSGFSFLWKSAVTLLVAGALSVALFGLSLNLDFLNLLLRTGRETWEWFFNSSLFLLIDNLQTWFDPDAVNDVYQRVFRGLTYALQAAVPAGIIWLAIKGHRERWIGPAVRHFDFTLGILLFLLWSRTLWEHYLAVLFLPLLYVVAARALFSRQALRLVSAVFAVCVFQNLIFTNWLRASFTFDSLPALIAIAVFKSSPLLLTIVFLWRHWRELFRSYAAWSSRP